MGGLSLKTKIKLKISSIGWKLFLWGAGYTQEQYWEEVYLHEKAYRNKGGK